MIINCDPCRGSDESPCLSVVDSRVTHTKQSPDNIENPSTAGCSSVAPDFRRPPSSDLVLKSRAHSSIWERRGMGFYCRGGLGHSEVRPASSAVGPGAGRCKGTAAPPSSTASAPNWEMDSEIRCELSGQPGEDGRERSRRRRRGGFRGAKEPQQIHRRRQRGA